MHGFHGFGSVGLRVFGFFLFCYKGSFKDSFAGSYRCFFSMLLKDRKSLMHTDGSRCVCPAAAVPTLSWRGSPWLKHSILGSC